MLKYIDKNGKKKPLIEYSNLCIEEVLDYGDKTLTCNVSMKCSVALEDIIRTRTNEYVIKQKNGLADDGTYTVTAKLNIDELEGTPFISFDTTEKTALEAAQLALAGTGWTCECDVKKKRTIRMTNASSWEILKKIVDTYMLEMQIDSINKVIRLKEKIGSYKGAYFTDQINLISLESQANTNDFYTRIYPIGKDGLTIKSVNNGSTVLENHIYSSKNKTYIWKDERYTDPQSLKEDAAEKLADMAQPYIAYSCSILDLSQNSKKYKNYNIGDEVVLIDSFSKTKIKQRIKKISRYPDDPSKDTCEIANLKLTFTEMQQKLNDAADTVNNITTDNGTVDGSSIDDMDANKLTNIDDVVSKTESFKSIKTEVLTVTGELQSASGKIGELETNKLDSETARITYATIENLKGLSGEFEQFKTNDFTAVTAKVNDLTVGVEKVKTLMFGSATGESITTDFANSVISMIGTAQIKDSMIDSLDAKKIKALDIDTTDVAVHSKDGLSRWSDNTIQISDSKRVRVQIGKDTSGDYNMYVWDVKGNLMFDALGLTEQGVQREIIRNDMVKENANISAGKLDIASLFSVINNDGTHTLKSNKIYLDDAAQTLNVLLQDIKTGSGKDYSEWGSLLKQSDDFITQKLWWTENIDGTSVKEKFSNVNQTLQEYSVSLSNLAKYDDEIYLISYVPTKDNYPAWDWCVPVYPSDTQFPREETWQYNDTEWDKYIGKVAYWESEGRAWRFIRNTDGSHGWKEIPNSETAYMLKQNSALRINLDSISSSLLLTQQDLKDNYSTTMQMNNAITQSVSKESNSIKLEVSNNYATKKNLESYATTDSLESYATTASLTAFIKNENGQLRSAIEAIADTINITARGGLNISGDRFTLASTNTTITADGTITCKKLNAKGSTIGGYAINDYTLVGAQVGISSKSGYGWAFWAGSDTPDKAPFRVGHTGEIHATNADIEGTIKSNNATITGGSIKIDTSNSGENIILLNCSSSSLGLAPDGMSVTNGSATTIIGAENIMCNQGDGSISCKKMIVSNNAEIYGSCYTYDYYYIWSEGGWMELSQWIRQKLGI
jgi:phage minor structural protein|uniref:phage tail protein n=1 Tax=Lachnospira eligens TaxID=39485 RepID=UPI002058CB2D|nr:MAG TPA: tail protein [Caudoviricetes sp.]